MVRGKMDVLRAIHGSGEEEDVVVPYDPSRFEALQKLHDEGNQ